MSKFLSFDFYNQVQQNNFSLPIDNYLSCYNKDWLLGKVGLRI
jgi:hypothetical protein